MALGASTLIIVDVYFQLGAEHFVWDADKAAANFAKHGISFETAAEVFVDVFVEFLSADVYEETRQAAIGQTFAEDLLYVVSIEREDLLIRIISARAATNRERRIYENSA